MATPKKFVQALLLLMFSTAALTKAASDPSSFHCGNPQEAMDITSATTNIGTSSVDGTLFNTIDTSLRVEKTKEEQLIPHTIHWHIYAIDNDETPKYSCYPEGLVEPRISGSSLQLAAKKDRLKELGYHRGDAIQSSINLYIPLKQLRNIQMDGVGEVVEVIVNGTLLNNVTTSTVLPSIRIRSSGVNSKLYVHAPYSPIYFSGSGVDTEGTMSAGRNSTVQLSGVNQRIRIKSEHLNGKIDLSGVNIRLMVQGDYDTIDMSGVNCKVQVNGPSGCNKVHNSGVNNNCGVPSSEDANNNITVPELECLSTTTVVEGSCSLSVGAIIGISIALVLVIGLCVFGCLSCCRRGRQHEKEVHVHVSSPLQVPDGSSSMPPAMTGYDPQKEVDHVVEAEVIEIQPSQTMMDVELAKDADAKVYA